MTEITGRSSRAETKIFCIAIKENKPGTAKVGVISKTQNCKRGDLLSFVKLQLVAKYEKNVGDPWGVLKNL